MTQATASSNSEIIFKMRLDRLVLPEVGPASRLRRPLGLAPVAEHAQPADPGPLGGDIFTKGLADLAERERRAPANLEALAVIADDVLRAATDRIRPVKEEVSSLRHENERLRTLVAELRSKVSELDFITERLKVENRGPPGLKGERGRDGPPGPRGERGARGETGLAAPRISAWEARPERFEIVPVFITGERGPPINLLSIFQAFHNATQWIEDADLEQAAQEARAEAERDAAAARWGR